MNIEGELKRDKEREIKKMNRDKKEKEGKYQGEIGHEEKQNMEGWR